MGDWAMVSNENVYFRARKEASRHNERLASREMAAELIGVSPYTLADYELGNTKVVPVDKVVLMADLYNAPELKTGYCKSECPIGRDFPLATEQRGLEGIALRLISSLESARTVQKGIVDIAKDGKVTQDEKVALRSILEQLDRFSEVISEIRLYAEKVGT